MEDLLGGESLFLEYKESLPEDNKKWLKTVVAFANGKGGKIIFGIKDGTKKVCGIESDNIFKIMDSITDSISESCYPQIICNVYLKSLENKNVIITEISSGFQTPYYLKSEGIKDGVYIRIGATTRQADETIVRSLLFEGSNKSYDQQIVKDKEVSEREINALSKKMYSVALENCKNDEEKKLVKRPEKNQLLSWGILAENENKLYATNAFVLLSKNELWNAKVQCAVFKGTTRAIFVDRKEYAGSVFEQLEEAYKFVLRNIRLGAKINGLYREDVYELPIGAIRELIVNAIVHRNYLEHSNIQVALYDDRLEITSPGGFPKGISVDRIKAGFSKIRNEALGNAFFYMRLIEHWGSGIPRIIQETKDAELKELEIVEMESFVRFNLYRTNKKYTELYTEENTEKFGLNEVYSELGEEKFGLNQIYSELDDKKFGINEVYSEPDEEKFGLKTEDFGLNPDEYTETEISILKEISVHPTVKTEELAEKLGISQRAVEKQIRKLRERKIIERVGSKKTGFYQIIKKEDEEKQ